MKLQLLYSDFFVFTFVIALGSFLFWASRKQYYKDAWRSIRKNIWALICLGIVLVYTIVAVTDSVHFRFSLKDGTGEVRVDSEGNVVWDKDIISLFDIITAVLYPGIDMKDRKLIVNTESRYSAPFQSTTFEKQKDNATQKWAYADLNKPGAHWMGTDKTGGDVFYKLLKGIRTAIVVGLITTMIAVPFAIFFGVSAGYFGGRVDDVIQFIYITLGSIPSILLISAMMIIVQAKMGSGTGGNVYYRDDSIVLFLCAILGLIGWSGLCRLLRAETIKLRELDYVQAAKALGVHDAVIIVKHIVPNLLHVVLISSILRFSGLVMVEAILAYIKIGVPATIQSWGRIVDGARTQMGRDPIIWWPVTGAFIFMFFLVLSINIFGDAVRDALDPKLRT